MIDTGLMRTKHRITPNEGGWDDITSDINALCDEIDLLRVIAQPMPDVLLAIAERILADSDKFREPDEREFRAGMRSAAFEVQLTARAFPNQGHKS